MVRIFYCFHVPSTLKSKVYRDKQKLEIMVSRDILVDLGWLQSAKVPSLWKTSSQKDFESDTIVLNKYHPLPYFTVKLNHEGRVELTTPKA